MLNSETIQTIRCLAIEKISGRKIAEQLNIDRKTVYKYIYQYRDEIEATHFADLEDFAHEHHLLKSDRIKRLGALKEKVDSARIEVDLRSLKPKELILLQLHLEKQLSAELAGISLYIEDEKKYSLRGEEKSSKEVRLRLDR
jgi:hypothetical protein